MLVYFSTPIGICQAPFFQNPNIFFGAGDKMPKRQGVFAGKRGENCRKSKNVAPSP
jgi:hypothetical protein